MANPQGKPVAIRESSPLSSETETHCIEDYYEDQAATYSSSSCCCFHGVWWKINNNSIGSNRYLLSKQEEIKEGNWFVEKAKKAKEISEVIAGPKWKNFIRGFNKKRKIQLFQYDPQSYALNFDDGIIDKEIDQLSYPDFLTRHATSALQLGRDHSAY